MAGKPYLVHFWATWCGPCKGDLPQLKALAADGLTVVGFHRRGTPADKVETFVRDQKLGYPTVLAAEGPGDAKAPLLAEYPAGVFPYCVLIDAQGRVACHGFLADVAAAARAELRRVK